MSDADDFLGLDDVGNVAAPLPSTNGEEPAGRVFIDAYEFVEQVSEPPTPLMGTERVCVLPAGGLGLVAGRPGVGKTTLILDLACHLAAGQPWPPKDEASNGSAPDAWPVPKALNVALVENEGPIDMFRSKLKEKLEKFPWDIRKEGGSLSVSTFRWGAFSFADAETAGRAAAELDDGKVELVIGDPLATLGMEGVGSPAETWAFVQALRKLGLGVYRSFLFLHHFRERADRTDDEIARLSGAWGGHLDTLLTLQATGSVDQARLGYGKIRWAKERVPTAIILGRVWNTSTFATIGEEGDVSVLEPLIYGYLTKLRAGKGGQSGSGFSGIAALAKELGHSQANIRKALEGAPHLFDLATGDRAKNLGAKTKTTKLWGLIEWSEPGAVAPAQATIDDPGPEERPPLDEPEPEPGAAADDWALEGEPD